MYLAVMEGVPRFAGSQMSYFYGPLYVCVLLSPPPPPPVLCLEKELGSDSVRTCIFGAEGISIGMMQDHL